MRFGHVELPVSDPMASLAWYVEALGFELEANQGDRFVWVRCGQVELLLRPGSVPSAPVARQGVNHVLYSHDLAADVARLRQRGVALHGDGSCYWLHDPDGHWWQLVDPTADHSADADTPADEGGAVS